MSWHRYLDARDLEALSQAFQVGTVSESQRAHAVEGLAFMFEKRRDDGAHYQASVQLKARALLTAAAFVGPLVGIVAVTTIVAGDIAAAVVVLTAVAGGLGSTLTGARELRGVLRINDLRSLSGWNVLQPLIGAGAGLAILLFRQSGIVTLPGVGGRASWAAMAIYGFLAGSPSRSSWVWWAELPAWPRHSASASAVPGRRSGGRRFRGRIRPRPCARWSRSPSITRRFWGRVPHDPPGSDG